MKDIIGYLLKMIAPPIAEALIIVGPPNEIDFTAYTSLNGEPLAHGAIIIGEPTDEDAERLLSVLKPGAHLVMIPTDTIGYKGVITLEDKGFEVRDSIFTAENQGSFYYSPKASRSEREAGLPVKKGSRSNTHPTVKPVKVMEWCARDITQKSKVVDPFLGSGTTGIAMSRLGHDFVGIEINSEYADIAKARINHDVSQRKETYTQDDLFGADFSEKSIDEPSP